MFGPFVMYTRSAGLCKDGGRQCECHGGAGHTGRGRAGTTAERFQEDLPDSKRPKLLKCESSLYSCGFVAIRCHQLGLWVVSLLLRHVNSTSNRYCAFGRL